MYRSKFEERIAKSLTSRGEKFKYEPFKMQYWKKVRQGYCENCGSHNVYQVRWYLPDFVLSNGIIVEAKGRFTSVDRTKMLAVIEAHSTEDIRMVFMCNNPIKKGGTYRYSDWCEKHDITYAIKEVPDSWLV